MALIDRAINAINDAESAGLLVRHDESILTGFSGKKLVGFMQRMALDWSANSDACYLEIGVFQGLTLLSVASSNPSLPCYGIDNFAFFDPKGQNLTLVNERRTKLGVGNAHVINLDYEDALENLSQHIDGRRIAIYLIDGPHDYRSQLMCLELALPHLHDDAVIVVDDANYRHVRQANRDFLITHPDYALLFEAYTACHPSNMSAEDNVLARSSWWNGVNILVKDPERRIRREYPPTLRDRTLFEEQHSLHSENVAAHARQAIRVAQLLDEHHWYDFPPALLQLYREMRSTRPLRSGLYKHLNTFSNDLPAARLCTLVDHSGQ